MQATFLLGPAGSGKTHGCLGEIRAELLKSPEGLPLVLLAPKQATFLLERQLLDSPRRGESLADASGSTSHQGPLLGYTRLQILSFERLAGFVLAELSKSPPRLLEEEGRVMVLRALLAQKQSELKIFRASARLPGFARQLSLVLREFRSALGHVRHTATSCAIWRCSCAPTSTGSKDISCRTPIVCSTWRRKFCGRNVESQTNQWIVIRPRLSKHWTTDNCPATIPHFALCTPQFTSPACGSMVSPR